MKKYISIILILALFLSLTSCSSPNTDSAYNKGYDKGFDDGYIAAIDELYGPQRENDDLLDEISKLEENLDNANEYCVVLENAFYFYRDFALLVPSGDSHYHIYDCVDVEDCVGFNLNVDESKCTIYTKDEAERRGYTRCEKCYID